MKAVILAGGAGVRLRPMSLGMPKPMLPLLGRPVMEHTIALLRRHGKIYLPARSWRNWTRGWRR